MSTVPYITRAADGLDLSSRIAVSTTTVASPSAATETIIASITLSQSIVVAAGIYLTGWAAYTVGTSGVSVNLRIRQTNASGTIIAATGASSKTAANLYADDVNGYDTAAVLPGQVYVLTMTVGSGAATSTVSKVFLTAMIV